MTTLFKHDYDFCEIFEASANWLCPEKCTELLIIASGGGGGGGAGAAAINPVVGAAGGAGGVTSFIGIDNNLTFPGGAGGAGGQSHTTLSSIRGGHAGKSTNGFPSYKRSPPVNAEQAPQTNPTLPQLDFSYPVITNHFYIRGTPASSSALNSANPIPARNGSGLNGGSPGVAASGTGASTKAPGGSGGVAWGKKIKTKVTPLSIYSIIIGVGGNGGNNGDASFQVISGGNGGAGGFVVLMWNE